MTKEAGTKIDNCMKVMKFGGTSVGSVNSILSVKQIVEAVEECNRSCISFGWYY